MPSKKKPPEPTPVINHQAKVSPAKVFGGYLVKCKAKGCKWGPARYSDQKVAQKVAALHNSRGGKATWPGV